MAKKEYPEGIKWTKQRKEVYAVLQSAAGPLSAAGIYRLMLQAKEAGYALSTVYRILAAFEEKGLVEKTVSMEDGTVLYRLNQGGHTHYAVCLSCHKRVALAACPFQNLHPGEGMQDFEVTGHKLELYGYCKECKIAADRTKSGENQKI